MKFWVPFSIMLMIVTGVVKFLLPFLILGLVLVAAYVLYATGQKLGWNWQQILQTNARTVVAAVKSLPLILMLSRLTFLLNLIVIDTDEELTTVFSAGIIDMRAGTWSSTTISAL